METFVSAPSTETDSTEMYRNLGTDDITSQLFSNVPVTKITISYVV